MTEEDGIRSTIVVSSWPTTPAMEAAGSSMESAAQTAGTGDGGIGGGLGWERKS